MKRLFTAFLILSGFFSINLHAQTGRLALSQTNNGSTIDVSIYLKRTGAVQWNLGFASFVFNYNYDAINTPVETGEGIWDNNSNVQYDDQIVAQYNNLRCASIEIGLSSINTGTEVPGDSVLAGRIRFNISNPTANHNLSWNTIYSSIIDNNGNDISQNIAFIDPSNSLLPVELTSFTFRVYENNVLLNWITLKEFNNAGFDIERKNILQNEWTKIGFVQGKINSNQTNYYEFADKNLSVGIYNYRLKQIDVNGNYEYYNLNANAEIINPLMFQVSQNYPNPFNPSTVIQYQIPFGSTVKITLFNLAGKEVKTLINEFQESGYHEFKLNAVDLISGVYFYKVESGNYIDVKSMVLLK